MNRIVLSLLGTVLLGIACTPTFAADQNNLAGRLLDASADYQIAAYKAYLDRRTDAVRMEMDERVAAVGMGDREAQQMREEAAVRGPGHSGDSPTAGPLAEAFKSGQAAWNAWKPGKTAQQLAAGKRLYAAWLTYMQTLATWPGDPNEFDQTPAGIAWTQAMNEYRVDAE